MKEMFIPCASLDESKEVIGHLVSIGYANRSTEDELPNIIAYADGDIISTNRHTFNFETVTPQQLLNEQEPQNMNKLKDAVLSSGFNKSELSRRLGRARGYINEVLRAGCSTAKQEELRLKIEMVKNGEVFKTDAEVIAELSEKLANAQDTSQGNAEIASFHVHRATIAESKVKDLESHLSELKESEKFVRECNTTLDNEAKAAIQEQQRLSTLVSNHEKQNKQLQAKYQELESFNIDVGNLLTAEQNKTKLLEDELTKAGEELLFQDEKIDAMDYALTEINKEKNSLKSAIANLYISWGVTFIFLVLAIYFGWVVA
ncbi:MAG: hypothetical protein [Caudoviricetes sp.]|nr:MAG: hypothetical protein [Caudoviricetes sp.]